jgi:hypothetical protein
LTEGLRIKGSLKSVRIYIRDGLQYWQRVKNGFRNIVRRADIASYELTLAGYEKQMAMAGRRKEIDG